MKTYKEVEVQFQAFLTLALDIGKWSVSCPRRFISGKGAPGIHWGGSWVCPKTSLDHL
jgi:hypothetical protein